MNLWKAIKYMLVEYLEEAIYYEIMKKRVGVMKGFKEYKGGNYHG